MVDVLVRSRHPAANCSVRHYNIRRHFYADYVYLSESSACSSCCKCSRSVLEEQGDVIILTADQGNYRDELRVPSRGEACTRLANDNKWPEQPRQAGIDGIIIIQICSL